MNKPTPITNLAPHEVEAMLLQSGETRYRAQNLTKGLHRQFIQDFSELTSLRRSLKAQLPHLFSIPKLKLANKQTSEDGTQKFLFELEDGLSIETVLIPDVGRKKGKRTLCLSSQVGCAMGCTFCLTGRDGLKRHLQPWEIVEQYRFVSRETQEPITHLVFMGMGEPLHNLENLLIALDILTSRFGSNIPASRITVSTSGLIPQIQKLLEHHKILLAVTLSAVDETQRSQIMPVNQKYSLNKLLAVLKNIQLPKRQHIFFEYVLLAGFNDQEHHALTLAKKIRGLKCKVNLIPFNEIPGFSFKRPSQEVTYRFHKTLRNAGISSSIRIQRGEDILGACGQLSNQPKPIQKNSQSILTNT